MNSAKSIIRGKALRVMRNPRLLPYYIKRSLFAYKGQIIYWPAPGKTAIDYTYYFKPQGSQVLVMNRVSAVSAGTERAIFNGMPNTLVDFPFNPGYSSAGQVVLVGPQVRQLKPGDRVATKSPHATIYMAEENEMFLIPEEVEDETASFHYLGVITLQGVRKARIAPGDQVVILGQGMIGQIATQLATAQGAYPVISVAQSAARQEESLNSGAHTFLSIVEDLDSIERLGADVAIETSGNPQAIMLALRCIRSGGRVILLGSPRGITTDFPFRLLEEKLAQMQGAHISSLPRQDSIDEWSTIRAETEAYFALLQAGKLRLDHLITDTINPEEAEWFYRQLSTGKPPILGAILRWDELPLEARIHPMSPLASLPRIKNEPKNPNKMITNNEKTQTHFNTYPQTVTAATKPDMKPMKIGLIGCGEIAVLNAQAIRNSLLGRVTMTMDIQEELAKDLAKKYDARHTANIEELFDSEIQAVLISTPHYLHASLAIKAAERGKHVILEKPIALNVEEAQQIITACRQANVALSVMYCERYQTHIQVAKNLILSGALGRFLGASLVFQTDKSIAYWSGGFTGRVYTDWRTVPEKSGGGVLIFNMVHYLDILRYLSEEEVTRVSSEFATLDSPTKTEDTIALSMQFANQAVASVLASSCVRGASGWFEIRLWGVNGQISINNPNLTQTPVEFYSLKRVGKYAPSRYHSIKKLPVINERSIFIDRFIEAVNTGKELDITGEDALAVQKIVEAAYRSGISNSAVEIEGKET